MNFYIILNIKQKGDNMKDIFIKKDYWYYLIKHCSENFNDWFDKDFHQKKVCLIDRILFRK